MYLHCCCSARHGDAAIVDGLGNWAAVAVGFAAAAAVGVLELVVEGAASCKESMASRY